MGKQAKPGLGSQIDSQPDPHEPSACKDHRAHDDEKSLLPDKQAALVAKAEQILIEDQQK